MPSLKLFGPDTKYGARKRPGFKTYQWYITWTENRRERSRKTGYGREQFAEAQQAFTDWLTARGEKSGPRHPSEFLIADALRIYAEEHGPHVKAPERIGYANVALLKWWGDRAVADITKGACQKYSRERVAGAGVFGERDEHGRERPCPATIGTAGRELRNLRAAINFCHEGGDLTIAVPVWCPSIGIGKDRWLTRQEAAALIRAARKEPKAAHLVTFILIALYTGARSAAIFELQWTENLHGGWVDLDNRRIWWRGEGDDQSKKRRPRATPIPGRLLRHLRAARKRTRQYAVESGGQAVKKLRRSFATAAMAAGLKDVSPHTLRHTCVTWKLLAGQSPHDVGHYVGMDAETVRRRYGHHAPEFMRDVAEAMYQHQRTSVQQTDSDASRRIQT